MSNQNMARPGLPCNFIPSQIEVDSLISRAGQHELGVDFLKTGSLDAVAVRCVTSKRYSVALVELEHASLDDEQVDWIAVEVTVECPHAVPDVEHDIARPRMRRSRAVVKVLDATTAGCGD